ncbi:MAG: hypothetical protein V4585_03765 [Bacteroidota bacterium]
MNVIALKQLFAGEDIYLLKDEFKSPSVEKVMTQKSVENTVNNIQNTAIVEVILPNYYQPKRKVIILLNNLNPTDNELLTKILSAVKLDLQSVDVIELDKTNGVDLSQIILQKSVNHVISFGIVLPKVKLEIALTPYEIKEKEDIKFIFSDALTDLQNDIPKKKALWSALKAMF